MSETEQEPINTHNAKIGFGKHKGELMTRLPVSYLKWMVQNKVDGSVELADGETVQGRIAAAAELDRRGSKRPDVEISAHSVDRMSTKFLDAFQLGSEEGEGIYTFMQRITLELSGQAEVTDSGFVANKYGVRWVIDMTGAVPLLKTVK